MVFICGFQDESMCILILGFVIDLYDVYLSFPLDRLLCFRDLDGLISRHWVL